MLSVGFSLETTSGCEVKKTQWTPIIKIVLYSFKMMRSYRFKWIELFRWIRISNRIEHSLYRNQNSMVLSSTSYYCCSNRCGCSSRCGCSWAGSWRRTGWLGCWRTGCRWRSCCLRCRRRWCRRHCSRFGIFILEMVDKLLMTFFYLFQKTQ